MTPPAKTAKEVRSEVLATMHALVNYWANESRTPDTKEKLDGLAFSILNIFDGTNGGLPGFDIVCRPHPDDESYHRLQQENWYPDGETINKDGLLHEQWYRKESRT